MDRREFIKVVGVAGSSGAIAGCTGGDGEATDTPTEAPDGGGMETATATPEPSVEMPNPFRIGKPAPIAQSGTMAVYPGFRNIARDRHGIDIEFGSFRGYTPMVGGFLKGEIHTGYLAVLGWVRAVNQNIPIKGISGFTTYFPSPMMVPPGTSWSDLEGQTIAVHAPGSAGELIAKVMVRNELGSVDAVDYEFIIGTPNRLAAMREGQIQGTIGLISSGYAARSAGEVEFLALPWDYDEFDNTVAQLWVLTENEIEESSGVVQNFVTGMQDSYEWMYETDAGEIVDQGLEFDDYAPVGAENWESAVQACKDNNVWDSDLSQERLSNTLDLLMDMELIGSRPDPTEIVTTEFL
jgi:hypothetical protein